MKRALTSLVLATVLSILPAKSKAEVHFPTSGVWSQPRLKHDQGTFVNDYDKVLPGWYKFQAKLIGDPFESTTEELIMELEGKGTSSWNYGPIKLPGSGESIRYRTCLLPDLEGDYTLSYSLGDEEIRRDFTVIPEPATLATLGLGSLAISRRRRQNNSNTPSKTRRE